MALDADLSAEEFKEFHQNVKMSKKDYMEMCYRKGRFYLVKEEDSTIPAARRKVVFLAIVHYGVKALFWSSVIYGCFLYLRAQRIFSHIIR